METTDLQKRSNDAGIRLVMIEIEAASALLAKVDLLRDTKQKMNLLKDAEATIQLASRLASLLHFSVSDEQDIPRRLQQLKDRLDQWLVMVPNPERKVTPYRWPWRSRPDNKL